MYWKYEMDQEIWQPKEKKVRKERKKHNKKKGNHSNLHIFSESFLYNPVDPISTYLCFYFLVLTDSIDECVYVCVRV